MAKKMGDYSSQILSNDCQILVPSFNHLITTIETKLKIVSLSFKISVWEYLKKWKLEYVDNL